MIQYKDLFPRAVKYLYKLEARCSLEIENVYPDSENVKPFLAALENLLSLKHEDMSEKLLRVIHKAMLGLNFKTVLSEQVGEIYRTQQA